MEAQVITRRRSQRRKITDTTALSMFVQERPGDRSASGRRVGARAVPAQRSAPGKGSRAKGRAEPAAQLPDRSKFALPMINGNGLHNGAVPPLEHPPAAEILNSGGLRLMRSMSVFLTQDDRIILADPGSGMAALVTGVAQVGDGELATIAAAQKACLPAAASVTGHPEPNGSAGQLEPPANGAIAAIKGETSAEPPRSDTENASEHGAGGLAGALAGLLALKSGEVPQDTKPGTNKSSTATTTTAPKTSPRNSPPAETTATGTRGAKRSRGSTPPAAPRPRSARTARRTGSASSPPPPSVFPYVPPTTTQCVPPVVTPATNGVSVNGLTSPPATIEVAAKATESAENVVLNGLAHMSPANGLNGSNGVSAVNGVATTAATQLPAPLSMWQTAQPTLPQPQPAQQPPHPPKLPQQPQTAFAPVSPGGGSVSGALASLVGASLPAPAALNDSNAAQAQQAASALQCMSLPTAIMTMIGVPPEPANGKLDSAANSSTALPRPLASALGSPTDAGTDAAAGRPSTPGAASADAAVGGAAAPAAGVTAATAAVPTPVPPSAFQSQQPLPQLLPASAAGAGAAPVAATGTLPAVPLLPIEQLCPLGTAAPTLGSGTASGVATLPLLGPTVVPVAAPRAGVGNSNALTAIAAAANGAIGELKLPLIPAVTAEPAAVTANDVVASAAAAAAPGAPAPSTVAPPSTAAADSYTTGAVSTRSRSKMQVGTGAPGKDGAKAQGGTVVDPSQPHKAHSINSLNCGMSMDTSNPDGDTSQKTEGSLLAGSEYTSRIAPSDPPLFSGALRAHTAPAVLNGKADALCSASGTQAATAATGAATAPSSSAGAVPSSAGAGTSTAGGAGSDADGLGPPSAGRPSALKQDNADVRTLQRRARNRDAARRTRLKKMLLLQGGESRVMSLADEVEARTVELKNLQQKVAEARAVNQHLRAQLAAKEKGEAVVNEAAA